METKELPKDFCSDGKSYYQGGKFFPDPTPLELPLGYEIPETLESMIARMVHDQQIYNNPELDSIDEADDFDVMDEEPILSSRHEFTEMQEEIYTKEKRTALEAAEGDVNQLLDKKRKPHGNADAEKPPVQQKKLDENTSEQ